MEESGQRQRGVKVRREFREMMSDLIGRLKMDKEEPAEWKSLRRGWVLGTKEFVESLRERVDEQIQSGERTDSWSGPAVREAEETLAEKVLERKLKGRKPRLLTSEERLGLAEEIRQETRVR